MTTSSIRRTTSTTRTPRIPPLDRHQVGGYVGGPIVREKTFFFGSYEGLRQDRGLTSISRVPSRATRNRTDINAATRPYLLMYPEPNGEETGASGLYSVEVVEPTRENYFVGKVDHSFSADQSMSVRYSWDKASVVVPLGDPALLGRYQHEGAVPGRRTQVDRDARAAEYREGCVEPRLRGDDQRRQRSDRPVVVLHSRTRSLARSTSPDSTPWALTRTRRRSSI